MSTFEYPYLDSTKPNLEGEQWKAVPDYEGYYEVSNLGRVKSLDRTILHPRLKKQFVKGRILKQKVNVNINTIDSRPMVDLQVALSKEGTQHYYNVRRLVYSAFVKPISFEKDRCYVINKDCDGFNNRLENIECVPVREKSKRAFERGRVPTSYLKYADRSKWENYGGLSRRKPVYQLDKNGEVVGYYESIKEASRQTGTGEKEIIQTAKGKYKSWNGYVWKYAEKD